MALINGPKRAVQRARAIVSDIMLYNEDKMRETIENDTFFEAFAEELEKGRKAYRESVSGELLDSSNFYDRAIVDVILRSHGRIQSTIW